LLLHGNGPPDCCGPRCRDREGEAQARSKFAFRYAIGRGPTAEDFAGLAVWNEQIEPLTQAGWLAYLALSESLVALFGKRVQAK